MINHPLNVIFVLVIRFVMLIWSLQAELLTAQDNELISERKLVLANTQFDFKLFREITKQEADKNINLAPLSLAVVLAMISNGAAEETKKEIISTLELQGMDIYEINSNYSNLMAKLDNLDSINQCILANSLWIRNDIKVKPAFMKLNMKFYGVEVKNLDFNNPGAPLAINAWLSKELNKKIEKIVEGPIDPLTVLYLINAVYFRGYWAVEFDREKTKEGIFTSFDGTQKIHSMMSQSGYYKYYCSKNFQAVSLPYSKGRISMYIFLPDKSSNLKGFYQILNAENWENWMSQFNEMKGNIVLPRFKLEYEIDLNNALKGLGMGLAFDRNGANFGNMCSIPPNVYIKNVKHKTFLEVNEDGTEAAAVTSLEMKTESASETFTIIVDRPFFYAIRDNETGTVLLLGSIIEPI